MSMRPSPNSRALATATALLLVTLSVAGGSVAATAQSSNTSLVTVNDTVRVHSTVDASVEGTTDLPAGENVTVRVRSAGDTTPRFFRTRTATVTDDGTFVATFDFSEYASGDAFTVSIRHDESEVASAEGEVVAEDVIVSPTPTATDRPTTHSPTVTDTALPGFGSVTVALTVILGFVLVFRAGSR